MSGFRYDGLLNASRKDAYYNTFIKTSSFQSRPNGLKLIKSLKKKIAKVPSAGPQVAFDWPILIVTLLVGIFAAGLVIAQFYDAQNPTSQVALSNLAQRIPVLEATTNLVKRDELCVPLSAYGRALDSALPPDARVFVTGMVGTNCASLGYYFFLRNYLFPRDVEISLDGHATFFRENWVIGVPCDSPDVLKTNGFDLMIRYAHDQMQLIPLTQKGVPGQE